MQGRLLLLPGYGEDGKAFDQLRPFLTEQETVSIDYRSVLHKMPFIGINSRVMAQLLIRQYKITPFDRLAGHSLGGFFSFKIREVLGNDICMIGSFCDPTKIVPLTPIRYFTPLIAATGLAKTDFARNYMQKKVAGKPHEKMLMDVIHNFKTFKNQELGKLSLITMENKVSSKLPNPLRIHADNDRIVRPPDEQYIKVPGGHFCLNLYPELVAEAMLPFLQASFTSKN